jgi:hypothetical protein
MQQKIDETTFTDGVSTFKFGATFKSTQKARFPLTIQEIASLQYEQRPIIMDIGASNEKPLLDLIQAIPFEKYYVADLNIKIFYEVSGDATWFYDEKGVCILMVTNKWVIYPEIGGTTFPFDKISRSPFARAPKWKSDMARIMLINPVLQARKEINILIEKHNILETWPHEKADLIIAANILNRSRFTTSEIKQALKNMLAALDGSGRIAIIENQRNEKAAIFKLDAGTVSVENESTAGQKLKPWHSTASGQTNLQRR